MQEYTVKCFEGHEYLPNAYIYVASDMEIGKAEETALLEAREIIEAMWYSEVPVIVGLINEAPEDGCHLYNSTHLLYSKDWQVKDQWSAFLVNNEMREMCKEDESLVFGVLSEELVKLFDENMFVVGVTHVQA